MVDGQRRTAVVTGGGRGIGAGIACRLAARDHNVAIVDVNEANTHDVVGAINAAGGYAIGVTADIADADQVSTAFERIAADLGPVGVLVNNAGVLRDNLLFKMTESDWDTVMSVHLKGAFLCCRAGQKDMVRAGYGRIVSISSTSALGNRGQANYSAAKAGLQGFTKTLAIELGKFGITVNCVAPGFIATEMTKATAKQLGTDWDDFVSARASRIPVGRAGQPDDIAAAVTFFTSEEAGYVTGQVLYVDGGSRLL
jgi:3-oxoacyl-[acyl-carrier protein] reductase